MSSPLWFHASPAESFPVRVRISTRARRVRLRVLPPGTVEVVGPPGFSTRRVPALLREHAAWLQRHLRQAQAHGAGPEQAEPPLTVQLPALGRHWSVSYRDGASRGVCRECGDGGLQVSFAEDWRSPLLRWVSRKGREALVPWLEQVSAEIGLPFAGVSIRAPKTRWGSCSSRRRINLNCRLLFLPPELVHYLLVHELCHTRHMNHSARYWALVAHHLPEYRELDRRLRSASRQVPDWARPA